ncbi:hypothetical protein bmyco0002_20510 [Bacillus pseudomycoides]|nr:hypothetical protein bmyco0002_20510 [Bacillus pseudomycoides]
MKKYEIHFYSIYIIQKEELIKFVNDEIVYTSEALEILECLRHNLNKLVKSGTLVPIKEMVRDRLFLKRIF